MTFFALLNEFSSTQLLYGCAGLTFSVGGLSILFSLHDTYLYILLQSLFTWAIYLVYFHSLASIPGPPHWALSRVFYSWALYRGRGGIRLKELHDIYGPVVRVAPDEVSFTHEKAWAAFYAYRPGGCLPKNPFWFAPRYRPQDIHETVSYGILAAPNVDHGRFRRAFAPSFTNTAIKAHEPMIQSHVDTLISQLHKEALRKPPFDITKWFRYVVFDITGQLGYSKSFHTLERAENRHHVKVLGSFLTPFTKEYSLRSLGVPRSKQLAVSHDLLQKQISYSQALGMWIKERLLEGNTPGKPDLMTYFDESAGGKGLTVIETENAMRDFMIAGTETVTLTLLAIFFHLVRNREVLHSLQDEIREAFIEEVNITAQSAANLPLLNAVINEAMRLAPSIPVVMPRVVADQGIEACGYWLPAGVCFSKPPL